MPFLGPGLYLRKFRSRRLIIIKEGELLDFTHCVLIRSAWSSWLSKAEPFKLTRPFCWRIAQAGDANAARQAALNSNCDQGWSDEGH